MENRSQTNVSTKNGTGPNENDRTMELRYIKLEIVDEFK